MTGAHGLSGDRSVILTPVRGPSFLLVLGALALTGSVTRADALPFRRSVALGSPARSVSVTVRSVQGRPEVVLGGGDRRPLPLDAVEEVALETVLIGSGHRVGVLRAADGTGASAAVLLVRAAGRARILWVGRTDPHGDPGERVADVLSAVDRTGDGRADIVVGQRREGAEVCGRPEASVLFPRAYDPQRGELRPVVLRRVDRQGALALEAAVDGPGPSGPPLLPSLRMTGASSAAGRGEEARLLDPPHALTDGDPSTIWAEGRGGVGRGEFVSARFGAALPIRAFAVILAAPDDAPARIRRLWLVGDAGPPLDVSVPASARPGQRLWIVPPDPLPWRCVTLVIQAAEGPPGVDPAGLRGGLAELEAYTALDLEGGASRLVSLLVEGEARAADEAARLLGGLGEEAARAVLAAWERLDAAGRQRGVRVFSSTGDAAPGPSLAGLSRAATDAEGRVRAAAFHALEERPPAGALTVLRELVAWPAPVGDEALPALLRQPAPGALEALLGALGEDGGADRPALRQALAQVATTLSDEERAPLEGWLLDAPPGPRAAALLGLAGREDTRWLVATPLREATRDLEAFPDRWRAVAAAALLEPDPTVDAWLASLARRADEWMLRQAGLEAMLRRGAPDTAATAAAALDDAYPRVRVGAIQALDRVGDDPRPLVRRLAEDRWPMVRAAAARALADEPVARPALRAAVADRSPEVRVAAIRALSAASDREAWPVVEARLLAEQEWPRVLEAALDYVDRLCPPRASAAVHRVLRRGLRPGAWPPDVDLAALAASIAPRVGDDAAELARAATAREEVPASIRRAARAGAEREACPAAQAR